MLIRNVLVPSNIGIIEEDYSGVSWMERETDEWVGVGQNRAWYNADKEYDGKEDGVLWTHHAK